MLTNFRCECGHKFRRMQYSDSYLEDFNGERDYFLKVYIYNCLQCGKLTEKELRFDTASTNKKDSIF